MDIVHRGNPGGTAPQPERGAIFHLDASHACGVVGRQNTGGSRLDHGAAVVQAFLAQHDGATALQGELKEIGIIIQAAHQIQGGCRIGGHHRVAVKVDIPVDGVVTRLVDDGPNPVAAGTRHVDGVGKGHRPDRQGIQIQGVPGRDQDGALLPGSLSVPENQVSLEYQGVPIVCVGVGKD